MEKADGGKSPSGRAGGKVTGIQKPSSKSDFEANQNSQVPEVMETGCRSLR